MSQASRRQPGLSDQELAKLVRKEIREWRAAVRLQQARLSSEDEGREWAIDFKFYLVALRIVEDVATQAKKHMDRQNAIGQAVDKFASSVPTYREMRDVLVAHIGEYIMGTGRLQKSSDMMGSPWGWYDRLLNGGTVYTQAGELVLPVATQAAEELCAAVLQVTDRISPEL